MKRRRQPEVILALLSHGRAGVPEILLRDEIGVFEVDQDGRNALHHAAILGNVEAAAKLIELGIDVNSADNTGWTSLHFATIKHDVAMARLLLCHGACVDQQDQNGNTPLFRAVFESRGRGEMVTLLRESGADPDSMNRHGSSPRLLASSIANYDVKKWLI